MVDFSHEFGCMVSKKAVVHDGHGLFPSATCELLFDDFLSGLRQNNTLHPMPNQKISGVLPIVMKFIA